MPRIDSQTLKRLLDENWAALVLYARQWCIEPEDAVQESFLKLVRKTERPKDERAWMFRVVRNQAISSNRSERRRRSREKRSSQRESWFIHDDNTLDAEAITHALQDLDDQTREIIICRIWGDLSFQQISDVCGLSVSTVHRRFENGLNKIRNQFNATCRDIP